MAKLFAFEEDNSSNNELIIDKLLEKNKEKASPMSLTADLLKQRDEVNKDVEEHIKQQEEESEEEDDENDSNSEDDSSESKDDDSDKDPEVKDDEDGEEKEDDSSDFDDSKAADDKESLTSLIGKRSLTE